MNSVELEEYRTSDGRTPFSDWLHQLRDVRGRARIDRRLIRLRAGLYGDAKPVGGGVIELREDFGLGYRIYCARHGATLLVLLAGGDKRTQQRDIEHAQIYWQDWKRRKAR